MPNKNKKLICAIIVSVILLIIDQVIKWIAIASNINLVLIPNVLELNIVQNTGGAFGIGQGNIGTFIITNIIVLGIIIRFICIQKDMMDKQTMYILFIILAGGFGNVIDRLFRGYVVDFINIFPAINFPRFNLADMYITLGWVALAFVFAKFTYKEIKQSKK